MTSQSSLSFLHVDREEAAVSREVGSHFSARLLCGFGLAGIFLLGLIVGLAIPSHTGKPVDHLPVLSFSPLALPAIGNPGSLASTGLRPAQRRSGRPTAVLAKKSGHVTSGSSYPAAFLNRRNKPALIQMGALPFDQNGRSEDLGLPVDSGSATGVHREQKNAMTLPSEGDHAAISVADGTSADLHMPVNTGSAELPIADVDAVNTGSVEHWVQTGDLHAPVNTGSVELPIAEVDARGDHEHARRSELDGDDAVAGGATGSNRESLRWLLQFGAIPLVLAPWSWTALLVGSVGALVAAWAKIAQRRRRQTTMGAGTTSAASNANVTSDTTKTEDTGRFKGRLSHPARYSARSWGHTLKTMPQSQILARILSPICAVMSVTLLTLFAHRFWAPLPALSTVPHALLGSTLGLLLVFRTNSAYARYYKAIEQWGRIVDECRSFASLVCVFMEIGLASRFLYLIAAFPWVVKSHLQGERDMRALKALLPKAERDALKNHRNQPQYLLTRMRAAAHQAGSEGLSDKEREMLMKSVATLNECVGACERIVQTPIPLHYSRHTSRFVMLYCASLPITLISMLDWVVVPAMFLFSWALFGILEIGYLIEEPFSCETDDDGAQLLPLNLLCRTVRNDVKEVYNMTAAGAFAQPLPVRIDKIGGVVSDSD